MVVLLGGVGCAGKTLMAQRLLEKYQIPYLSIDHLKMGIIRGTDDCGFCASDSDELITGKLWGIIKGIIMTNIENGQNIIIEGCYMRPRGVAELGEKYRGEVVSAFIGFSENYINNSFQSGISAHASEIERRGEENPPPNLVRESRVLKAECEKYGAKYFEIEADYEKEADVVFAWLGGGITKILSGGALRRAKNEGALIDGEVEANRG